MRNINGELKYRFFWEGLYRSSCVFSLSRALACDVPNFISPVFPTYRFLLTSLPPPLKSYHSPQPPLTVLLHPHTRRPSMLPPLSGRQAPQGRRRSRIQRLPSPHNLIALIQLNLDGTAHLESPDRRPHATLAVQDPVLEAFLCGGLEQFPEIARTQVRH